MMFCVGLCSRIDHIVKPGLRRISSSSWWTHERNRRLRRIYAPFAKLVKGSPEYDALAESGKAWEDYFQPGDGERYGYSKLQKLHATLLEEIDGLRASLQTPRGRILHSLVAVYAHQSVFIENNRLLLWHSLHMDEILKDAVPDLTISASKLSQLTLPNANSLLPNEVASQVAELRNHIVASHWVTETALRNPRTAGLSEEEIRHLSALLLKNTSGEKLYKSGWGGKVALGEYRRVPIQVKSNPLTVFPYHIEVPESAQRLSGRRSVESATTLRIQRDGKNTLPQPKINYLNKSLAHVFGDFCSVLWVGVIIFFICWRPLSNPPSPTNLALAMLVLIVIILQAAFSAFQDLVDFEGSSKSAVVVIVILFRNAMPEASLSKLAVLLVVTLVESVSTVSDVVKSLLYSCGTDWIAVFILLKDSMKLLAVLKGLKAILESFLSGSFS
ncbi:hypothetical protein V8C42DRAFT_361026 [Trichoderma barbatum]